MPGYLEQVDPEIAKAIRGETERHVKEREDIAASLTRSMNEALARLRGEPV